MAKVAELTDGGKFIPEGVGIKAVDKSENEITVKQAMDRLSKAMVEETDYAYGWHANIAMACTDSMLRVKERLPLDSTSDFNVAGNEAATQFMKICFNSDTSKNILL